MMVVNKAFLVEMKSIDGGVKMFNSAETDSSPRQVWACLPVERQNQVIRLMAQLAFNFIVGQTAPLKQESHHVMEQPREDSSPAS